MCHNRRIRRHKVFRGLAARGKTSVETCGIEFFAKPKRNMKNHLMRLTDKLLARKRAIVKTVIDQLKNISVIGQH